jgi:hypothetical protein
VRVAHRIFTVFAGSSGLTLEILLYGSMDRASPNSELVALVATLARVDASLTRIETRLERIERAAPALLGVAIDAFDDATDALAARDVDPSERLHNLFELLERASRRGASQRLSRWLDWLEQHPAVDTGLLELASHVADAFEATQRQQSQGPNKRGPLAVLRALSEASVQRSLGFGLSFLRQFGHSLARGPAQHALPSDARRE